MVHYVELIWLNRAVRWYRFWNNPIDIGIPERTGQQLHKTLEEVKDDEEIVEVQTKATAEKVKKDDESLKNMTIGHGGGVKREPEVQQIY